MRLITGHVIVIQIYFRGEYPPSDNPPDTAKGSAEAQKPLTLLGHLLSMYVTRGRRSLPPRQCQLVSKIGESSRFAGQGDVMWRICDI